MAEPAPLTKDLARRAFLLRNALDRHAREVPPLRQKLEGIERDVKAFMGLSENIKTLPPDFETRLAERVDEVRAKNQALLEKLQQDVANATDPKQAAQLRTGIVATQRFLVSFEKLLSERSNVRADIAVHERAVQIFSHAFETTRKEVRQTPNSPAARQFQEIMNGVDLKGMDGVYERNPARTSGDALDYAAKFRAQYKIEDSVPPR